MLLLFNKKFRKIELKLLLLDVKFFLLKLKPLFLNFAFNYGNI